MLCQWEKEFKVVILDEEIELYIGKEVQQVVGFEVYCGVLKYMGGGQIYLFNMLFGLVQVVYLLGVKIFEFLLVVEVNYGKQVWVCIVMGSVKVVKLLWVCDSFFNNMELEIYNKMLVIYFYQVLIELFFDELIECISLLCGVFSDICLVINYYCVIWENCLLFGSVICFVEYMLNDFVVWNCILLVEVFFYFRDVKIDFVWGGLMVCSVNLFLQIGILCDYNNVFYVQGYFGFGVILLYIVCKIFVEGIDGGFDCYCLLSSIFYVIIYGCDSLCLLLVMVGKLMY